jgi:hypothetical protein
MQLQRRSREDAECHQDRAADLGYRPTGDEPESDDRRRRCRDGDRPARPGGAGEGDGAGTGEQEVHGREQHDRLADAERFEPEA